MPIAAGFQEKASSVLPLGQDSDEHAGGGDQDGQPLAEADLVAQKCQAEHGHLHRLGLDVGGGNDERALLHGGEHESGRGDLGERGTERPCDHRHVQRRDRLPRSHQHEKEEQDRERQPEQEAHMRGADRAEDGGQLLLHGVAQHLAARSRNREDSPKPGHAAAPPVTARRPRGRQIRPSGEPRNRGPGMSDARRLWADQPSSCQRPSARRQAMPSAFAVAVPMLMVSTMCRQTRPAGSLKDAVGCTMPLSRPCSRRQT